MSVMCTCGGQGLCPKCRRAQWPLTVDICDECGVRGAPCGGNHYVAEKVEVIPADSPNVLSEQEARLLVAYIDGTVRAHHPERRGLQATDGPTGAPIRLHRKERRCQLRARRSRP